MCVQKYLENLWNRSSGLYAIYAAYIGVRFRNSILTSLSLYMYFEVRKWLDIKGRGIFARPISIVDSERNRVILRIDENVRDWNNELICRLRIIMYI